MRPVSESLQEYARGVAGGLLFSLPLLFTMEVWWAGANIPPLQLIVYVIVTFLLLIGYNRFAGLREGAAWAEVIIDSVEEIGIGFIISLIVLWNLGRIDFTEMVFEEAMGKIVIEAMTVAIGVSIGTAQLGGSVEEQDAASRSDNSGATTGRGGGKGLLALCGSILIAGNIAPTEEVPMVAFETSPLRVMMMVAESLVLGAVILFFSDFRGSGVARKKGIWLQIVEETVIAYVISLCSAMFMLWFFGRLEGVSFELKLFQIIILGMPAMLGASAGRLLIK